MVAFLDQLQMAWGSVDSVVLRVLLQLALVVGVSYGSYWLCHLLYRAIQRRMVKARPESLLAILLNSQAIPRALQVVPLIVAGILATRAVSTEWLRALILTLTRVYFAFICANVFAAAMNLAYRLHNWRRGVSASPQKGIFQVLSLLGYLFAAVGIVATLSGRDPTYVLSGMTALSAVLMLVFKDSILGLTAGVTLASNGMVRIGDWIEVPGTGADGEVIDIALTTVRVQNWDNTITTVPAYDLIAKPFKNWRGMSESGGRRIKRAILIDLDSIHFADEGELERWKEIDLIRDYLASKIREVRAYNAAHPSSATSVANARKLTNIGTFRAYCLAYLRANPAIHQRMTIIVRQLDPSDRGLPLEIYCFSSDTAWANYESIQSDLFDHLLAIMPEFGLISFQVTSATALRQGLHVLPERPKAKA
ncbi:MAG: mechanosensitive ion channel family protein [Candidatus Spyradenecus sp.]